jgi:hypothetical protein
MARVKKAPLFLISVTLAFFAWLYYSAGRTSSVTCEACITFEGRTDCGKAAAATREDAMMQTATLICSKIAGGMTDVLRCQRTPPDRVKCTGESAAREGRY